MPSSKNKGTTSQTENDLNQPGNITPIVGKTDKTLKTAAFYPRESFTGDFKANLYALYFPKEWVEPLKGLQGEKTGRPDKNTIPIRSLNNVLGTFIPYLASLPPTKVFPKTSSTKVVEEEVDSSEDSVVPAWLIARQPVEVDKIWLIIKSWLKQNFRNCPSYPQASNLFKKEDLKSWVSLSEGLFDENEPLHKNGTINLTRLAYTALPVWLADELVSKKSSLSVYGQECSLIRVPIQRGAELVSWPPVSVEDPKGKKGSSYFSYSIRITVQTVVGISRPIVHFHYGVRRWVSEPLLTEDNKLFLGNTARTALIYRTKPWLKIPATHIFTQAELKGTWEATASGSNSRRVPQWNDAIPEIASALGLEFPTAERVVKDPSYWLKLSEEEGLSIAILEKTPRFHRVGVGLGLEEHERITNKLATVLSEWLEECPIFHRLPSIVGKRPLLTLDDLRDMPVETRKTGLVQTVGRNVTVEVLWQNVEYRDMVVDRVKSWLFGTRPNFADDIGITNNTLTEMVDKSLDRALEVVTPEDSETGLIPGLDLSEDDDTDEENELVDSNLLNPVSVSPSKKRPRKRAVESDPIPALDYEEISLDDNGARLRIIVKRLGSIGAIFDMPSSAPRSAKERGEYRRKNSEARVQQIEREFLPTSEPTLCLVELPNYRSRKNRFRFGLRDPKLALRRGLAHRGRLTKFIAYERAEGQLEEKDKIKAQENLRQRCNGAVRDGLRMLGFLPDTLNFTPPKGEHLPENLYIAGVWYINLTSKKTFGEIIYLPVVVIMSASRLEPVRVWLPDGKGIRSYYNALLDISKLDNSSLRSQGNREKIFTLFKYFLEEEAEVEGLTNLAVLVVSQNIRRFWPGINNNNLANDKVLFEKDSNAIALSDLPYALRLIRLRTGDSFETPEWFTKNSSPGKGYTQGIWQLPDNERVFYNIAGKPHTQAGSRKGKQVDPSESYALPSILEIVPSGLQSGDNPTLWAYAVNQWRRMGYTQTSSMTILPLPLHWAKKMSNYAEVIGPWVFSSDWELEADQEEDDDAEDFDSEQETYEQLSLSFPE